MTLFNMIRWQHAQAMRVSSLDVWPEHTLLTVTDAVVDGQSLTALARRDGTPCLRIGLAKNTRLNQPTKPHLVTALVTTVEHVIHDERGRIREVWVDAELDGCHPRLDAARRIGRHSGRLGRITLRPGTPTAVGCGTSRLPLDTRAGDLIAIPCEGATALYDVQRHCSSADRLDESRCTDTDWDGMGPSHCLKS